MAPTSHLDPIEAGKQITRDNMRWGETLAAPAGPITFGFRSNGHGEQPSFSKFNADQMAMASMALAIESAGADGRVKAKRVLAAFYQEHAQRHLVRDQRYVIPWTGLLGEQGTTLRLQPATDLERTLEMGQDAVQGVKFGLAVGVGFARPVDADDDVMSVVERQNRTCEMMHVELWPQELVIDQAALEHAIFDSFLSQYRPAEQALFQRAARPKVVLGVVLRILPQVTGAHTDGRHNLDGLRARIVH